MARMDKTLRKFSTAAPNAEEEEMRKKLKDSILSLGEVCACMRDQLSPSLFFLMPIYFVYFFRQILLDIEKIFPDDLDDDVRYFEYHESLFMKT